MALLAIAAAAPTKPTLLVRYTAVPLTHHVTGWDTRARRGHSHLSSSLGTLLSGSNALQACRGEEGVGNASRGRSTLRDGGCELPQWIHKVRISPLAEWHFHGATRGRATDFSTQPPQPPACGCGSLHVKFRVVLSCFIILLLVTATYLLFTVIVYCSLPPPPYAAYVMPLPYARTP